MATTFGPFTLRSYQEEALEVLQQPGRHRHLLSLATGLGKTIVFCGLIAQRLEQGRALVLVHTDELVQQTHEKLRLMLPGVEIGTIKAEANDVHAPIIVASRQTLARPKRLAQLEPDLATLVVDEGHHATANNTYNAILAHCGAYTPNGLVTIGATATPFRADGEDLLEVYEGVSYERDVLWGIANGYLVDVRAIRVMLAADLSRVHTRYGDFVEGELAAALEDADAPQEVVRGYQEHAAGRQALAYFPSVQLAEEAAHAFCQAGIPTAAVSGATPRPVRQAALADLRAGRVQVVTNCAVLSEGYDEPSANCILMARPTKSRLLYIQTVGRGLRPFFGKEDTLVLDFVGNTGRHRLVGLDDVVGKQLDGRSVLGCLRDEEARALRRAAMSAEAQRKADEEQRLAALVGHPVNLFDRRPTQWAVADDLYVVGFKEGQIAVEPTPGGYVPMLFLERGMVMTALTDQPVPLEYAHAIAEDWIARNRPTERYLSALDARWRMRPPSERAVAFGAKWGLEPEPDETGGAFSDRLSIKIAQANLQKYHRRRR
jgi:superfamily II DNA or RNA helicase